MDILTETQFVWEDGTEANIYIPWYGGAPDDNGNQHCVLMTDRFWWRKTAPRIGAYQAFDTFCGGKHYSICEKGNLQKRLFIGQAKTKDIITYNKIRDIKHGP